MSGSVHRTDNLYNFDTAFDVRLSPKDAQIGRQIDLLFWFPFYGSLYNYTVISKNGFIAFAQVFEEGLDIHVGPEVNWPEFPDPAMIAPYMCPQKYATQTFGGRSSGVRYKLLVRPDLLRQKNVPGSQTGAPAILKLNKEINYAQADEEAARLLDEMKKNLADGMVGAENFEPDIALVVTWLNMTYAQASAQDEADKVSL
uniref:NIDO domain-containing protein n=1 Tax=Romanomermis culicivorax TaxID=13658 RepID=A0A915LB53_ROMCU